MIRLLIIVVIALSLVWSGYWILGSRAHRGMVVEQFEKAEAEGWKISYSGVELNGFPNRFDTMITDLRMVSPQGGFIWETPSLRLLTLSYRPNHLIAVLPDRQRLVILGNSVDLTSQIMRASIEVSDPDILHVERFVFEISRAEFKSSRGWKGAIDDALFAVRESDDDPTGIDVAVRFRSKSVNPETGDSGAAEELIKPMTVIGEASLKASRELGLNMCRDGHAEIQRAEISQLQLSMGEAELGIAGSFAFDSQGVSDGQLNITITNGQLLVAEAVDADLIDANVAANIDTMLSLLAMASAGSDSVTAPISISNGRAGFAGMRLYDVPRLPPICD